MTSFMNRIGIKIKIFERNIPRINIKLGKSIFVTFGCVIVVMTKANIQSSICTNILIIQVMVMCEKGTKRTLLHILVNSCRNTLVVPGINGDQNVQRIGIGMLNNILRIIRTLFGRSAARR